MSHSVLVVEDDKNVADLIRLYLNRQGYTVDVAVDGVIGLKKWEEMKPDLVLLDLGLPRMDGWQLYETMAQKGGTPVIVISARGDLDQKLHGFELGVDDYVVKPFDPLELVARVAAVLRRSQGAPEPADPSRLEFPGLMIDSNTYRVTVDGEEIDLKPREIQLLHYIAQHPGRVFSRDFLLQELWGYDYTGETRTVDVHIHRLREKIERPHLPWSIRTVWGVGYAFEVRTP
ncbi:MAG: response regulator transcription factor [Solirubrobacterales bacterium]